MTEERKRVHWSIGREYINKICSTRFISAAFLLLALSCCMTSGIGRLMQETNERITPWMAPHFFNNRYFVTFYGLIICYLFSDVPFMNRSELYFIMRKGRPVWCMEKMLLIVMQAFTFSALAIIASVLVFAPMVQFDEGWGKIIHTLAYSQNMYGYPLMCIPSTIIMINYTPIKAMLMCFVLVGLVSSMVGLLMMFLSLYANRLVAVAVTVVVTGLTLADNSFITMSWPPYVTPFNWCRMGLYEEAIFLTRYYPSLQTCLCICSVVMVVCIIGILFKTKHMEFDWNKEE